MEEIVGRLVKTNEEILVTSDIVRVEKTRMMHTV
jgi:hypothetical protein